MRVRHSLSTLVIAVFATMGSAVAVAQGNGTTGGMCLQLEARLADIERGNATPQSGPDQAEQFDVSIARQRSEINRATAEARRAGCTGGFLIFQRRAEAKCPLLMSTIDRMQDNLRRLMEQRGQYASDPFSLARERNDVLRQLAMSGCRPAGIATGLEPRPQGLLASLFGGQGMRTWGEDQYFGGGGTGFGTYRTLCVRTCDGFYFPISFSTIPAKFEADAFACQQMCPQAETMLFTHRNPGEDPAQMVSLSGEPYTALPAAFRFRQEYDKTCTCGSASALLPPNFTDFAEPAALGAGMIDSVPPAAAFGPAFPMPNLRPVGPGEDPETAANRRGGLVPGVQQPVAKSEDPVAVTADGRQIRIVGPASFYAP